MASRRRTDASTGIQRIDARSGTIMPGLVDAGFHPTYFNVAAFEDLDIKYPVEYVTLSGPCGEVTIRDLTKGKELERKDAGKWSK